ncbi:GNAT family N-acetyltransferase [candidate division CSSED10-310 bacterium]|uniref:GNAT family N-acetyltransferase n=1 Tax=candidate division CSSED10-310 bacterium TaxID=2855610 RepID=A0ABV6YSZ4_UNCC1
MTIKPEFRLYQPADRAEIETMVLALYAEDSFGQPMTTQKIQQTIAVLSSQPDRGEILIFTVEQQVVGYAMLIFYWSNEYGGDIIFIDELYIKAAWRNRGIGKRFFEYVIACDRENRKAIQLEVTPLNQKGLDFFQKQGFHFLSNTSLIKKL